MTTIDPVAVWAGMKVKAWPERYWMLGLPVSEARDALDIALNSGAKTYSSLIHDQSGVSLIANEDATERIIATLRVQERIGPFRMLSTDGELPFNVVGFLRPLLEVINAAGIKAGPLCGVDHDHLFVYDHTLDDVQRIVSEFIESAAKRSNGAGD